MAPRKDTLSALSETPATSVQGAGNTPAPSPAVTEQETLRSMHQKLVGEERVRLSLAPQYRPYFGKVMVVSLGGIPIYFPVDGMSYAVPRSYAKIIQERRRRIDAYLMRKNRLADVRSNLEGYAGELQL